MRKILEDCAALFGVTRDELISSSRTRRIAEARQTAAWVLRRAYPSLSLEEIGRVLGGRDHTTIIYSITKIEQRMREDRELATQLHALIGEAPPAQRRRTVGPAMRWWANAGRASWLVLSA